MFSFWVERVLLRTLAQRATERAFHPGYQGRQPLATSHEEYRRDSIRGK